MDRRRFLLASLAAPLAAPTAIRRARASDGGWDAILAGARGQTVFFNAWGGDENTNAFIAWVGQETAKRFGVTVEQVKLRDTSEAVARVLAEQAAGRATGGSVDLVWINGPNFLAMKSKGLLFGPATTPLPNWPLVDQSKPSNLTDFTVPVDGLAVPWRIAQVVFVYDAARTPSGTLPRSMAAMVGFAKARPGRLSHPQVRDFLGATFLKQALVELAPDTAMLADPATDARFTAATAPLWAWYDALRPSLWRQGRDVPESGPALLRLLEDAEVDLAISFNPAEAALGIARKSLPESARVYVLDGGTIGNTSFVAIPFNAAHREGALTVANMLLEPAVQARAQDPDVLGAFTVLDVARLAPADRALFAEVRRSPAMPTSEDLGSPVPEPHPSWMTGLIAAWESRYAR
jgi:putative thiamine transport system substrate-binding protein